MSNAVAEAPKAGRLAKVKIADIREAEVALRKNVNKEDVQYQEMRDSVRQYGILNPVSVREIPDPADPTKVLYCLVDGLHRTTCAREVGLDEIPAQILDVDSYKAFELQFIGNLQRVETKHADYAKALVNLLAMNPTLTKLELATQLNKSTTWLDERLKLATRLEESIQKMVNDGVIKLANAQALCNLPPAKQLDLKEAAMSKGAVEFAQLVQGELQAIRKAEREGTKPEAPTFEPRARFQTMSAIVAQIDSLAELKAQLVAENITSPIDAARLALKWTIRLDPVSVADGKKKWDDEQAKKEADKAQRQAERQKAKEEAEKNKPAEKKKDVPSEFPTVKV